MFIAGREDDADRDHRHQSGGKGQAIQESLLKMHGTTTFYRPGCGLGRGWMVVGLCCRGDATS